MHSKPLEPAKASFYRPLDRRGGIPRALFFSGRPGNPEDMGD